MPMYYRKGYKYQLAAQYQVATGIVPGTPIVTEFIELNTAGVLTIRSGYASDGPSGPTIDTKTFMRGAFVHDAFYQLMRMGRLPQSYREDVDKLLRKHCREDGMSSWRAWYVYHSLRKMGAAAAKTKNAKKVYMVA